jgi:dTDP-4-dehydrorhamnose reductase
LKGELACIQHNPGSVVIRTSWLYSEFGNNFVKTMIRLMKERPEIKVVNDQIGSPTYAGDLARDILEIIRGCEGGLHNWQPGIYHYSNQGVTSWHGFATEIATLTGSPCKVLPIPTREFPTPAKRPAYSVLDSTKIRNCYGLRIPHWKESLALCLHRLGFSA